MYFVRIEYVATILNVDNLIFNLKYIIHSNVLNTIIIKIILRKGIVYIE